MSGNYWSLEQLRAGVFSMSVLLWAPKPLGLRILKNSGIIHTYRVKYKGKHIHRTYCNVDHVFFTGIQNSHFLHNVTLINIPCNLVIVSYKVKMRIKNILFSVIVMCVIFSY